MSDDPRSQVLYRMYDTAGELLYVGISVNAAQRWAAHRATKPWWTEIASIKLEHFPDRTSVAAAERAAIRSERPRYNIQDMPVFAGPAASVAEYESLSETTARLIAATRDRVAAAAELDEARAEERAAIIAAVDGGVRQVKICEITEFTREHIRRIVKAGSPGDVRATGTCPEQLAED